MRNFQTTFVTANVKDTQSTHACGFRGEPLL
jgi:hypothetical protein